MEIENENNFKNALLNGINLFLGSGFSVLAKDREERELPTGNQLCSELMKRFGVSNNLSLPQVSLILNKTKRGEFKDYLTNRFRVEDSDPIYKNIEKINIKKIFTTNIDNLLYKIYEKSNDYYLNDIDFHGATRSDQNAIDLIYLHGSVMNKEGEFIFDSTQLAAAFAEDPDRWNYLVQNLETYPTLFWGYSFNDVATLQSVFYSQNKKRTADVWIVVHPDTDEESLQYYRVLNFQIIKADTYNVLEYFKDTQRQKAITTDHSSDTEKSRDYSTLKEWIIPKIREVPARQILDFYRGDAPEWYDIFSGKISSTDYHAIVRNSLNAGHHVVIIGVAGCGKTTLLMQVLSDFEFPGIKLFFRFDEITKESARLILNKLNGRKALIAIDGIIRSLQGYKLLLEFPNVLTLSCERDYFYAIISHKVPRENKIIDITDLNDRNMQALFDNIPNDIRQAKYVKFEGGRNRRHRNTSIYELIENNITVPNLSRRYINVLEQISQEDERLRDFMLVCSYVNYCSTSISMDMLLAFFRDEIYSYIEIYKLRKNLRNMIFEDDDPNYNDQDYYDARSSKVAEAVIKNASPEALKKVILQFHEKVSPYRTHNYNTFKKRAFDADIMKKIFSDWEEGKRFYRKAHERDKTPFVLQQGALYLMHKKEFKESFSMIDEALIASENRIPSIRHSHAIILFNTNIDFYPGIESEKQKVKETLEESMKILGKCYEDDRRKEYHAAIFADQALKYQERFPEEESKEYLKTAKEWLIDERKKSRWHRGVRYKLKDVEERLKDLY